MEDAAFFTSLAINLGLCCIAMYHLKKCYRSQKLRRWQAFALYSFSTLVAALIAGFGLLSILIDFYQSFGFIQELGHNAEALACLVQFVIPVVSIPAGLILINWQKMGCLNQK
jgi:hypothetical protein